jgi:hypothetical protein
MPKLASDRSRPLREGELIVDCRKALDLLQKSGRGPGEDTAAEQIGISRSVLRRIIGKGGGRPWAIILSANANLFATKCGGQFSDIEWIEKGERTGTGGAWISSRLPILQKVRWEPTNSLPAGVIIYNEVEQHQSFIAWDALRVELESKLLPQLFAAVSTYRFAVMDYHDKKDWTVKTLDANGNGYCWLWLGVNPDSEWKWDGLVRVGGNSPPYVWQTYERYSDGSYRRIQSKYKTLEDAKAQSGV